MKKLIRLVKEAIFAVRFYKNWWTYIFERFGAFGERTILIKLRNGLNYRINTNTSDVRVLNELWNLGIYDRLKSFVSENGTVVDIGGHIGVFTAKAASWGRNVRVFSYEPMPKNFELLKENIALNHFENRITPTQAAVADTAGTLTLYVRKHESGGGSLYKKENAEDGVAIAVNTVTLKDVFDKHGITQCDFMKIDCEGGEVPILTTAPRELFPKIRSMSIEWHEELTSIPRAEFMKFLESVGYSVSFNMPTGTIYAERK
ncbi:MAG: FkbM family methyltransferase [Candidatus Liptonbacteria bacterium]